MPAHIVRLLLLLAVFLIAAVGARYYVLDPSYYQFGNYRGDAVIEATAGTPQYRGPAYCQACHADRHSEWKAGAHSGVKCEACHGPAGEHPTAGALEKPDDTIKLCTLCHEAMPGRPASQPQIVVTEHPFKHEGELQCMTCHNPHSPAIGGPPLAVEDAAPDITAASAEAESSVPERVASLLASCAPCHGAGGRLSTMSAALAGQPRGELIGKLQDYRSGARTNPLMNTIASSWSDADIADLAEHYAGQPAEGPQ